MTGSLSDWVESGIEVTVILSVYKFETHVKHVAGPPLGRRRQSKQDGRRCVRVQDVQDLRKRTSLGDFQVIRAITHQLLTLYMFFFGYSIPAF